MFEPYMFCTVAEEEMLEKDATYLSSEYRNFGECCWCKVGTFTAELSRTYILNHKKYTIRYNPIYGECNNCGGS